MVSLKTSDDMASLLETRQKCKNKVQDHSKKVRKLIKRHSYGRNSHKIAESRSRQKVKDQDQGQH